MLKAVIFDMDGVLVNSEPLHYEADRRMLARLGVEVGDGYLDRFVGASDSEMWAAIFADFGAVPGPGDDPDAVIEPSSGIGPDTDLESVLRAQKSLKLKLLKASDLEPIEGIPKLLSTLKKRGIPLAIASSSPSIFIKTMTEKLGISRFFDLRVSGENAERGKPAPDVYLKAAERLGVAPESCAAIEDSRNGVLAAKAAGMKCVGFKNPASGEQDLSAADRTVGDIREISPEFLASLWD